MRKSPEDFGEQELSALFMARKLKQALLLEDLLTEAGVDYLVEAEEYTAGALLPRTRVGAFFYVPAAGADAARDVLRRNGFKPAA